MTTDAQTLNMLLGGTKTKKARKPSYKFATGMNVVYCGKPAKIIGRDTARRVWLVELNGETYPSKGKDMRPA